MMREMRMNEAIDHLQLFIQGSKQKFLDEIECLQMEVNIQIGDRKYNMRR